jgi:hypothetical protein
MRAILGNPILGLLYGFVDARLVLADRHGKSTAIGANEGIADEPADRANETLRLGRALLQEIDKLGGSFARILSDYCFHVGVFHLLFVCVQIHNDALSGLTRIRLHFVIYFCLHRGQFELEHCKVASSHS